MSRVKATGGVFGHDTWSFAFVREAEGMTQLVDGDISNCRGESLQKFIGGFAALTSGDLRKETRQENKNLLITGGIPKFTSIGR